jgi:hypothetical protein
LLHRFKSAFLSPIIADSKMADHTFDCTRLLLGVMSCLHIISAFAILVQMLTQEPIPDIIIHQIVIEVIDEYDLPPLSGKSFDQVLLVLAYKRVLLLNMTTREQKSVS